MSLTPPPKVQKLQAALHAKAKGSPGYRFYLLYDKVYRRDALAFAYQCCLANGGAAGVDHQTFADIEKYGVERWLDELAEGRSARRIVWSINTLAIGSVSGCVRSTSSRGRRSHVSPTSTWSSSWA